MKCTNKNSIDIKSGHKFKFFLFTLLLLSLPACCYDLTPISSEMQQSPRKRECRRWHWGGLLSIQTSNNANRPPAYKDIGVRRCRNIEKWKRGWVDSWKRIACRSRNLPNFCVLKTLSRNDDDTSCCIGPCRRKRWGHIANIEKNGIRYFRNWKHMSRNLQW